MNNFALSIQPFENLPLTPADVADLRSDHAGEAGAVEIYRGMLCVSSDAELRRFAHAHIRAERRHLRFFEEWLPSRHRSRLLPVWRSAGWLLGAISALCGRRTAYRTVVAVETFVEKHYQAQIEAMSATPDLEALVDTLRGFCAEEVHHRNDAARRVNEPDGWVTRAWVNTVAMGSAIGVRVARKI